VTIEQEPLRSVIMPESVVHMETKDGRLFVTLESGRVVDMTDWFSPTPDDPQLN
jgi:hypothetical protein